MNLLFILNKLRHVEVNKRIFALSMTFTSDTVNTYTQIADLYVCFKRRVNYGSVNSCNLFNYKDQCKDTRAMHLN